LERSATSARLTLALHTLPRRRQYELLHFGDSKGKYISHFIADRNGGAELAHSVQS